MAWVRDVGALDNSIVRCSGHAVFLDYPNGRTKPPVPVWTLQDAIYFTNKYSPKYLAVSNTETVDSATLIDSELPRGTMFVPKIESLTGVMCLPQILDAVDTDTIMLDTEDLYNGCADTKTFLAAVDSVHHICKERTINLLRLYGVVFSEA
jgi:citrate lyase beta subunit